MDKKILLLDTNFSAKPIYDYLTNTGAEVFVIGGNPQDSLAKSVQNYINLDYSNIEEVRSLIETLSIDYIVPGGNDFSYKVCSELNSDCEFYNIDTVEINDIINNKEQFRKFSIKNKLHVPKIVKIDQIKDFLPIIIKPVDAYSGHGMSVIYEFDDDKIQNAISIAQKFSKSKNYIIEEYVQGQLYSHSAFVVDGEIMIDFIVEEHCIVNQYVVDTSRVVYDFDKKILNQIREDISKMIKELELVDGLVHTQFISNGSSFWLIEVTRRCPGDLYSSLIELSTGFPYGEFYAKPFLNIKNHLNHVDLIDSFIIRHTITLSEEATFNSITFNNHIHILKLIPLCLSGDRLRESPFDRVAILFILTNSVREQMEMIQKNSKRKLYLIE